MVVAVGEDQGLEHEGNHGNHGHAQHHQHHQQRNHGPQLLQVEQGDVGALAGDGGIGFPGADHVLIGQHDADGNDHHEDGDDVAHTGVGALDGGVHFRSQHIVAHRQTQELGHREGAHAAGKYQDNGTHHRGHDHGNGDLREHPDLVGSQDNGRFLQVGVHISQNAADENIGKGRVVQAGGDDNGERTVGKPVGNGDAGEGGKDARGAANHGVLKEVPPCQRQGPGGHDVGEDEELCQHLLPPKVGPGYQPGEAAADDNGHQAGQGRGIQAVPKRLPDQDFTVIAGKGPDPVIEGKAANRLADSGFFRGVDHKGISYNGKKRQNHQVGQGDHQNDQQNIIRLAEKGFDLVDGFLHFLTP